MKASVGFGGQRAREVEDLGEALVRRAQVARQDRWAAAGGDLLAPAAVADRRLAAGGAAEHDDRGLVLRCRSATA